MSKGESRSIRFKKIWYMLKPSLKARWYYWPVFLIFSSLLGVLAVAEPYIYGSIVDSIIEIAGLSLTVSDGFKVILPFLLIWGGLVVFETSFTAIYMYISWYFGNWILMDFLQDLFSRILKLDVERFKSEKSGEMLRRFDNAWNSVWHVTYNASKTYLEAITRFGAAFVVGLYIDWRLTIVALLPIPLIVIIGALQMRASAKHQHGVNKMWEKITGVVGDAYSNIATVKSFSKELSLVKQFKQMYTRSWKYQMKVNRLWATVEAGYGAIYIMGRLLIFGFGTWFVLQGATTLGTMIMFLGFANFLFGSVQMIMSTLPTVSKSLVELDRVLKDWNEVPEIREKKNAFGLKKVNGRVAFNKVTFGYDETRQVLKKVSFTIPDGQTYAMVGESGAGKSTLAQMMLRYHDPNKGLITIDGHDIRDLKLKSLRSNVGFVMQENLLFHDSILNNIRLAKPSASIAEVEKAARRAQAHNFIKKLPGGYKSIVGERGVKLSGGEKQRIALARVFLEDPPILVLDEATSALDSKTEHALQTALKEAMKGRTSLVIAHRLSTVMDADQIIVMDKGRIVAQGTHEELIKKSGLYREYWTIQAGGYV